ncbi:DEAD/DEAH box helicase family protein [Helicobacter macacae]|uniref:Helicase/UvrB N-terminal domain-containing protein n=1 Tax=Helicobacter macacae MIT 99-5501 TaxID=1357400 RepID=V8C4B3_9HELI|nr:DEAD/DEAH box helicase family protein [Helicobacter macacae]ETD22209.1 hypothetical protein HMPREF2086_01936 [Helicobacter macacae MIT 99-5501]
MKKLNKQQKSLSKSVAKKLVLNEIIKEHYKDFDEFLRELEFGTFSYSITLQDYQQAALKNALIALKLYIGDTEDNHKNLRDIERFQDNALSLLNAYHTYQKQNLMPQIKRSEINRASFWMATGSGKTIVMIKLIALLGGLSQKGVIPKKPIMLLAPNDKILEQFRAQIESYNAFNAKQITPIELKDFERAQSSGSLFGEVVVYIARSDLLDTAENVGKDAKAKRLNYRNFLSQSGWYILLDEAHKGDSKDSVRKSYFNALASGMRSNGEILRNNDFARGFIFNFSATFEDELDLSTCAFNYNLERFNNDGYGKNIAVLDSDLRSFRDKGDEKTQREKIIESFVLFCAIKQSKDKLFGKFSEYESLQTMPLLYHNPLIIAVSDKVNTKEAGVKLYFEAILQILANDIDISTIAQNLATKLKDANMYFAQNELSEAFLDIVRSVDSKAVRESVFYASGISSVEACKIKGNDKELAFKSKNANKPFMLLNIGSTKEWEKHYLQSLGVESGEDLGLSYFGSINDNTSPINIMMGSKVFNEGWDSNRVNLICFINIGSKNAKKYVLQTIGRGVRIEPFANVRQRLEKAYIDIAIKENLAPLCVGVETLFIMASDYSAIEAILQGIEVFRTSGSIKGFKVRRDFSPLLVPTYKEGQKHNEIYGISKVDLENLQEYVKSYDEDILLLCGGASSVDMGLHTIAKIRANEGFEVRGNKEVLCSSNAFVVIDRFFHAKKKEFSKFVNLDGEICHFERFTSTLDEMVINEINKKIKELVSSSTSTKSEAQLMEEVKQGKISIEQYTKAIKSNASKSTQCEVYGYKLDSSLSKHYYNPLIIDEKGASSEKASIVYAIRHSSEVEFLRDLQGYILREDSALKDCEWCFCRLVENIDEIYIPYFDESAQEMRRFYPDFIFWIKRGSEFDIVFIDPKGISLAPQNAENKAQGFRDIFENIDLTYQGQNVRVKLVYYNKNGTTNANLKEYVRGDIDEIFS